MRTLLALMLVSAACAQPRLSCVSCGQGRFLSQQTRACTECPMHSSTNERVNATHISDCQCDRGRFNRLHSCHECVRGEFKTHACDVPCAPCHAHASTQLQGSFAAATCVWDAGHHAQAALECVACAAGSWKNASGNAACAECPADSFCGPGALQPTRCSAIASSAAGSARLGDCQCAPGFQRDASHACRLCAPGTFQPQRNQTACRDCPLHTFRPAPGASAAAQCLACDAHAHSARPGPAQCLCNAGFMGAPGARCAACEPSNF